MSKGAANNPPSPQEQMDALVEKLSRERKADIFLFSAGIYDHLVGKLIELIRSIPNKRPNAILILNTNGGSADAAYQLARSIKHHYKAFYLYIFGYCKSAGTLVAVAADEIVMSEFGQFGPLDVQLADKTEIFGQTAALDVRQALHTLSEASFDFFTDHFFKLGPGKGVPTDKAIEAAKALTLGVIGPIAGQIDPLLLGQVDRSMRIAEEYCNRLNPSFVHITKLVAGYPSHEFVIDYVEAKELFSNVRNPNGVEIEWENLLRHFQCVPHQNPSNTILRLSKNFEPAETSPAPTPAPSQSSETPISLEPPHTDNAGHDAASATNGGAEITAIPGLVAATHKKPSRRSHSGRS